MLRAAVARIGFRVKTAPVRAFTSSTETLAAAPPPRKKSRVTIKREVKEKIKKSGMTHLKFGEAVRQLGFEKYALDLEAQNLPHISAENLADLDSKVVKYDSKSEKILRNLGSFKKNQHHELFSGPVTMVTQNTGQLHAEFVEKLSDSSHHNRICLLGEKGSGKSTLISQIQALLLSQYNENVVLLHVDHAERIVDGTSDYYFNSTIEKFHQPMFTKRWVKKMRVANETVFKKMPLTENVSLVSKKGKQTLQRDTHTVFDYLRRNHEFGLFGPSNAFQFFLKQLQAHSGTFPVLVSVDNFNGILRKLHTEYFHRNMTPISLSELEFGAFLADLVSGKLSFTKGGVLLAESKDLGECKTLRVGLKVEAPNPYDTPAQCDLKYAESMTMNGGVKTFTMQNMTKVQAREFLLFLDHTGVLHVRQYPAKETYKSPEENALVSGKTMSVGENVRRENSEQQFESILQLSFFASAGNPGRFLKINNMTF